MVTQEHSGLYKHMFAPGEDGAIYPSAASGGYVSGVWNTIDAIRAYDPHVVPLVVTPWDNDANTYEVCLSVSCSTVDLLKSKGLSLAPEGFWEREYDGEYGFFKIVSESEIVLCLDAIQALVQHWNEQLG